MLRVAADSPGIDSAAATIRSGGLVIIPTDTLYGIAVDPCRADAVARVFALKERSTTSALPLVAADLAQIERSLGALPPIGGCLAAAFWPGPLTMLMEAPPTLVPEVTGGTGLIGVRVPAHEVTRALCRACDRPLTATSANLSGEPPTDDPDAVDQRLRLHVDLLLDAGRTPGGPPSSIVDVTGLAPRLVRAGAIAWEEIRRCVEHSQSERRWSV